MPAVSKTFHFVLHVLPRASDSDRLPTGHSVVRQLKAGGSAGPLAGPEEADGIAVCLTEPGGGWVAGLEAEASLEDLEEIQGNQTKGGKGVPLPATRGEPPG